MGMLEYERFYWRLLYIGFWLVICSACIWLVVKAMIFILSHI